MMKLIQFFLAQVSPSNRKTMLNLKIAALRILYPVAKIH